MEKVYRLLSWLHATQAADYLRALTNTALTAIDLAELLRAGHCRGFVNCHSRPATLAQSGHEVRGAGFGYLSDNRFAMRVASGGLLFAVGRFQVYVPVQPLHEGRATEEIDKPSLCILQTKTTDDDQYEILFKPADIEALAAKMNGESAPAEPAEKPLHPSERKSAGQIIATLAAMAGLDLSAPYAADETLRTAAAVHGLELPSSPETVVKFLKDAAARTGKT